MDTPTPSLLDPAEYAKFMLRTPAEVTMLLRDLAKHLNQVTVFFNAGRDMLLTTLAVVEADYLILDCGSNEAVNRKALEAEKHFCVTLLDKVRIQFILRGFTPIEHEGRPAFRCALPVEILRLQRREFFRLVLPVMRPLQCHMPLRLASGEAVPHVANVFDISGGGLGLAAPPAEIPFEIGMRFPDCRLELPEVGMITGMLEVKNRYEITLRSGTHIRRAGCEFVALPGTMATLVQRYIIKVERERKARESGLG